MSLGILTLVPMIVDGIKSILGIVSEHVEDKDVRNRLASELARLEMGVTQIMHLAELQVETIPWIDGVHKMGRQIVNLLSIILIFVLLLKGHVFSQWDVLLLGGPNVAYQLIKGKGK